MENVKSSAGLMMSVSSLYKAIAARKVK